MDIIKNTLNIKEFLLLFVRNYHLVCPNDGMIYSTKDTAIKWLKYQYAKKSITKEEYLRDLLKVKMIKNKLKLDVQFTQDGKIVLEKT